MKKTTVILALLVTCIIFAQNSDAQNDYDFPNKAVELIEQGNFDDAKIELNNFQRRQPGNPYVLFYLGQIENDHNRALWYYKEVEILADSVLASEALFRRAEIIFSRTDLSEAKTLYEQLIEKYSGSKYCADANYRLGLITLSGGSPGDAESYFNTCIDLDKTKRMRLLAVTGLMECYVAAEDWEKARETALLVIGEKDDYSSVTPRALEVIALSWRKSGNDENADEFTGRLLEIYPDSYQAYAIRQEGKKIASESSFAYDSSIVFTTPEEQVESAPSADKIIENAKFTVQVGAYKEQERALKIKRMLDSKGFNTRINMKTVQETHYFAVQVDYFATREEAVLMARRITGETGENAIVLSLN